MDLELLQRKSNKELIILLHNCIKSSDMKRADNIKSLVFEVFSTRNELFLTGGSIDVMDADGTMLVTTALKMTLLGKEYSGWSSKHQFLQY